LQKHTLQQNLKQAKPRKFTKFCENVLFLDDIIGDFRTSVQEYISVLSGFTTLARKSLTENVFSLTSTLTLTLPLNLYPNTP